jgi:hypothetical protein
MLRLGKAAGITRKVNLHSVRHLYNTTARALRIDRETRARLLNHSDTRTLEAYDHTLPGETARAREQVRQAMRIGHHTNSQGQSQISLVDFLKKSQDS